MWLVLDVVGASGPGTNIVGRFTNKSVADEIAARLNKITGGVAEEFGVFEEPALDSISDYHREIIARENGGADVLRKLKLAHG